MNLLSYPIGSRVKVDDPIFSKDEIGVITDVSLEAGGGSVGLTIQVIGLVGVILNVFFFWYNSE